MSDKPQNRFQVHYMLQYNPSTDRNTQYCTYRCSITHCPYQKNTRLLPSQNMSNFPCVLCGLGLSTIELSWLLAKSLWQTREYMDGREETGKARSEGMHMVSQVRHRLAFNPTQILTALRTFWDCVLMLLRSLLVKSSIKILVLLLECCKLNRQDWV